MDLRALHRSGWFRVTGLIALLSFTLTVFVAPAARAKIKSARKAATTTSGTKYDRSENMDVIKTALSRKKVRKKLQSLGYTPEEITERLSRLSDSEVEEMANELRSVKKGGHVGLNEAEVAVVIVCVILAPILIPFLILAYIFGHDVHLHGDQAGE